MTNTEFLAPTRFRASFTDPLLLLEAVKRLRLEGFRVIDTYSPFPVHGMDEAIGLKPSRLPRACLGFGLLGLATALGVQIWTSAYDYPLIVGGKPLVSLPAFIPVAFELTVLMAGLGVVGSLFIAAGMRPRFKMPDLHPGVNDDRFVVAAEIQAGASFAGVQSLLAGLGALDTELLVDDRREQPASLLDREASPLAFLLAALPAVLVLVALPLLNRDYLKRNLTWDGGMGEPVAYQSFDPHPSLPGGQVLQTPPAGTVSRKGLVPLPYGPGKAEAERAGLELQNPLQPTQANFSRGKLVYDRSCAACHGQDGDNNSSVIVARGLLAPAILVAPIIRNMPDGRIFHVATFGGPEKMKGLGDLISREDRWKVVLYIRELQKAAAPKPASAAAPAATPGAPS
ncbi:MAG: quinol:electron acceptor oxidoreductase subunit ActD [Holophagaceae bacterium]